MHKKAFPMGYKKPVVESMPRTGAGQKRNLARSEHVLKTALKAGMRGRKPKISRPDYKPPIHGSKK